MNAADGDPRDRPDPDIEPASVHDSVVPLPPRPAAYTDYTLGEPAYDRWAHRRGEPRVFAFLWTLYLFSATAITLAQVGTTGVITVDLYRPGARQLLIWVAVGIAVLWPMVRLSQTAPPRPVSAAFKDLVVLLVPAQAVIWPQWWLAAWPLSAVLAVTAVLGAWAALVGALLALSLGSAPSDDPYSTRRSPRSGRVFWTGAFVLLAIGGPLVLVIAGGLPPGGTAPPLIDARWMISPLTAVYEITRDRSYAGASALAAPEHWRAIAIVAAVSVPVWGAALVRAAGVRRSDRLH